MINQEDLELFIAFYHLGTLTRVSEEYNISQPSLTRAMKRLEDDLGVPLFERSANRLVLSKTGIYAVPQIEQLLSQIHHTCNDILEYEKRTHTIKIESCAPAPLWSFIQHIQNYLQDREIASSISSPSQIIDHFNDGTCDLAILPYPLHEKNTICIPFMKESLSVTLPKGHVLAKENSLAGAQLNGYNCLLASNIGFWTDYCHSHMPASRFLVQTDEFAFQELIRSSSLPTFISDYIAPDPSLYQNRVIIPLSDEDASALFYLCFKNNHRDRNYLESLRMK